ncbi:MAG TPA: YdcH family protein [Gammaproteobacteria bacterium]|nr:YdcH family protein [Gammaproteobacteria bacterium]
MREPLGPERHRALRRRLELLMAEHRTLDEEVAALSASNHENQLSLQRLKKRKLQLRDEIERVRSALIPDLNA